MGAFGHPPPYPACHFLAAERSAKRFPIIFAQMWRWAHTGLTEPSGRPGTWTVDKPSTTLTGRQLLMGCPLLGVLPLLLS